VDEACHREEGMEGLRHKSLRPERHPASATKSAPNCPSFWPKEPRRMVLGDRYGHARGLL
jgi:hypothetical protein